MPVQFRDLHLSYEIALHGVQSAVQYEISSNRSTDTTPKQLRIGINAAMTEHSALAYLLISKGVITEAEYLECLRLLMNNELAMYEEKYPNFSFR